MERTYQRKKLKNSMRWLKMSKRHVRYDRAVEKYYEQKYPGVFDKKWSRRIKDDFRYGFLVIVLWLRDQSIFR